MKKTFLMTLLLSAAVMSQAAQAQTKIGVVNPDRILRECGAAVTAQKKLSKEFESREKSVAISAKQLKADISEYQKMSKTMSPNDRLVRERQLADQERKLQRRERELREDLNRRRNEEVQAILMRSNQVIADIAKKGNFDLIVQEAVWANPKIDITDQVIKAMGK